MKRIAIICGKNLETFIDPIANALDRDDNYLVDKNYLDSTIGSDKLGRAITKIIQWCDILWLEWGNEWAATITNDKVFPEIKNKKVIVRLHSYEALSGMSNNIKWENVDRLIYVAEHIKEINEQYMYMDIHQVPQCPAVIIPNGINLSKNKFIANRNSFNIAWVGYINYKKNPAMMLQIMAKLPPEYKLYIAGSFQDRRFEVYLNHMVKELGLNDRVIFQGWIKDMNKWYKDKGILLHTTLHEGHSLCISESMARGIIPVIHNFYGASDQYPESLLFNTVDEAVEIIKGKFDRERIWLREYVLERGWTFKDMMSTVKEVINGI